jgi:hypothetical protein
LINSKSLILNPYRTINAVLATCILLVFIYSAVFSPEGRKHPVASSHTLITGDTTSSTGLSRSFSAILRLNFNEARNYNVYSLRVFLFFFIQFFVRIVLLFSNNIILEMGVSRFAMLDGIVSSVLFLFLFEPFLSELVRIWG